MSRTPYLDLNIPDKSSKGFVVTDVFEPNFTKLDQEAERVNLRKMSTEDNIEELKKSTRYKVGDIVEVLGYYSKGDGGGHPRQKKPEGYNGADAVIGADGSIWGIVHSGEVKTSWLGGGVQSLNSIKNMDSVKEITIDTDINFAGDNVTIYKKLKFVKGSIFNISYNSEIIVNHVVSEGKCFNIDVSMVDNFEIKFPLTILGGEAKPEWFGGEVFYDISTVEIRKKFQNTECFSKYIKQAFRSLGGEFYDGGHGYKLNKNVKGNVTLSSGYYNLKEKVNIGINIGGNLYGYSGIGIIGEGFNSSYLVRTNLDNTDHIIEVVKANGENNIFKDFKITSFEIIEDTVNFASKAKSGLYFNSCDSILVSDIWISGCQYNNTSNSNFGVGFAFNSSVDTFCSNLQVEHSNYGISVYSGEVKLSNFDVYEIHKSDILFGIPETWGVGAVGGSLSITNLNSFSANRFVVGETNYKLLITNIVLNPADLRYSIFLNNKEVNGDIFITNFSFINIASLKSTNTGSINMSLTNGIIENKIQSYSDFLKLGNSDYALLNNVTLKKCGIRTIIEGDNKLLIDNCNFKECGLSNGSNFIVYTQNSTGSTTIKDSVIDKLAVSWDFTAVTSITYSASNTNKTFIYNDTLFGNNVLFSGTAGVIKSCSYVSQYSNYIYQLDTPYHASNMQKLGILDSYHQYLTELHEYEKQQNTQSDAGVMNLNVIQPPVIPLEVEEYAKEFNLI